MKTKTTPKKISKPKKSAKARQFKAYMLRTCAADMTARGRFKWPTSGEVSAPDWNPVAQCGQGLHGLLWGEGDGSLLSSNTDAKWLVCGIDEWVDLSGKVKAPRATVIYCGTRDEAVALIQHLGGHRYAVAFGTSTSGYRGTSTSGYGGTSTSGDGGTSTSGYRGTSTSGNGGTVMVKWWDGKRYRIAVGYCGENGIEPNKRYRCDNSGNLIPA